MKKRKLDDTTLHARKSLEAFFTKFNLVANASADERVDAWFRVKSRELMKQEVELANFYAECVSHQDYLCSQQHFLTINSDPRSSPSVCVVNCKTQNVKRFYEGESDIILISNTGRWIIDYKTALNSIHILRQSTRKNFLQKRKLRRKI